MHKIDPPLQARALAVLRRALPRHAHIEPAGEIDDSPTLRVVLDDGVQVFITLTTDRTESVNELEGAEHIPVVIFEAEDPRERDQLREWGSSFIDLAGVVHLRTPGLYLDRTDLPAAPQIKTHRPRVDPYADRASRVVRALLTAPRSRRWSNQELADSGEVDVSTVSRVIRELRRRELVKDERPGQGRRSQIRVPDPEGLLEDWLRFYTWRDNRELRIAAPVGSPARFLDRFAELLDRDQWALTLQAGASLFAPHADFDVIHAYLEPGGLPEAVAAELGWEISPSGKLCLVEPFYAESAWFDRQIVNGIPVVGLVQLVLDLWHYPVRGREQANHLIQTVLEPLWASEHEQI